MSRIVHLFADEMPRGVALEASLELEALIGPQVSRVKAEGWLPGRSASLDHDALLYNRRDRRRICMAETLRRDFGRHSEPLLILPSLAQASIGAAWLQILSDVASQGGDQLTYRIWSTQEGVPERLVNLLTAHEIQAEMGGQIYPASDSALEASLRPEPEAPQPVRATETSRHAALYSPRKILFVIEKLADRSGGAERVLIETANALAKRGHMVEIVSHEYATARPFYDLAPGVMHTNLRPPRRGIFRYLRRLRDAWERYAPDWPLIDRLTWLSRNGGFWRRLQNYIEVARPDVAVAFMPPAMTALGMTTQRYELRRVASTHNVPEQDFLNPERWDPSRLDRRRRMAAMGKIDRIGVLLPEYKNFYTGDLLDRVLILPNAITPVDGMPSPMSQRLPVVMSVGRLASVKRHELLIEAWSQIAADFPEWEVQIYGKGPLERALASRIDALGLKTVKLMGHHKDIADRYSKASILAHPAEFEGFPLAPAEALAASLPVVAFEDCSGANTLVQNGINGVLVGAEGDRVQNFAASLRLLMQDVTLRQKLADAGPPSMAPYSPELVLNTWEHMMFSSEVPQDATLSV